MHKIINNTPMQVFILTIIGTLGAAVMVTGVKLLSSNLHPFEIAFFRCFFGLLIILPFVINNYTFTVKTKNFKIHILRSAINCISMLTWFTAIGLMSLEKATALGFTTPLFATLLAVIFLKEIIKLHRTLALIIGFVGIIIIIRPGYIDVGFGTYLMLVASMSWAFVLIIIKRLARSDSSLTIIFYMLAIMTPITLIICIPFWQNPSLYELLIFLCMGLGGLIAHLCLIKSLKIADTTLVMPFQYFKLLWASLIGFVIFFEKPDTLTWVGGTVVFLAVIYITYRESIYEKTPDEKIITVRPSMDN